MFIVFIFNAKLYISYKQTDNNNINIVKLGNWITTYIHDTHIPSDVEWEATTLMLGNGINSVFFLILHVFVFKMYDYFTGFQLV